MDADEHSQHEEERSDPSDTGPGEGHAEGERPGEADGRLRLDDEDVARLARQTAEESDRLSRTVFGVVLPAYKAEQFRKVLAGEPPFFHRRRRPARDREGEDVGENGAVLSEDPTQVNSGSLLRLSTDGWAVSFAGKTKDVPSEPTNGVRAIAYLLKVTTPKGGATEVRAAMDTVDQHVLAQAREEFGAQDIEAVNSEFGAQEVADPKTLGAVSRRLIEIEEKLELEDLQVEAREELADQKKQIECYLATAEGLGGRPRTWGGRTVAKAVGEAIRRAIKQLEKIHPELHAHLKDAIKNQYGQNVRYEPAEDTPHWDVRGI
jgi:hypothetical protein